MARTNKTRWSDMMPYWCLVVFLVLTFFVGGGARSDIQSLLLLRPAAILFCGIGLWSLRAEHFQTYRFLFAGMAAIFLLALIHIVPLPVSIWSSFPGRSIVVELDKLAGLGDVWRPISMAPSAAWNTFYSLFVPLAVLVLAAQLGVDQRYSVVPVLLALGLFSGFLGLMQAVGPHGGPLYFYAITNEDSAVGLFSNRNHQATLLSCLFPILAFYASENLRSPERLRHRTWIAVAAGAVLVPLLLVTGSRSGLLTGLVGLLSVPLIYRRPHSNQAAKRKMPRMALMYVATACGAVALAVITVLFSRAMVFERIISPEEGGELRFAIWPNILEIAWKYFPLGSGFGSFVQVYQIDENLQHISTKYINHAHNDWLELLLEGGLPAVIIVAIAVIAWFIAAYRAFKAPVASRRDRDLARLGTVVLLILALASVFDYPLRTPSMMCLAAVASVWCVLRTGARGASGMPQQQPQG